MTLKKANEILTHILQSDSLTIANEALEKIQCNIFLHNLVLSYVLFCEASHIPLCGDFSRGILLTLLVLEEEKISKECEDPESLFKKN